MRFVIIFTDSYNNVGAKGLNFRPIVKSYFSVSSATGYETTPIARGTP
jgi:hypothetical protein